MFQQLRIALLITALFIPGTLCAAGVIQLPQTGQTSCWDENGNTIDCVGSGQDGEWQAGLKWPEPRFLNNGDGTITDNLTGLVWLQDMDCSGTKTWQDSLAWSKNLASGNCGLRDGSVAGDWRLPNINELRSLTNLQMSHNYDWYSNNGFILNVNGLNDDSFFSSNTTSYNSIFAMGVGLISGGVSSNYYKSDYHHALPVRVNKRTAVVQLPKTGQTISYATGDDSAVDSGLDWPNPRFDTYDEEVIDNLTGLVWAKNANLMTSRDPGFDDQQVVDDGKVSWQRALDYIKKLNSERYLNSDDWRLPNVNELLSLYSGSQAWPALPANHPFVNVSNTSYWTSDTAYTPHAFMGGPYYGGMAISLKNSSFFGVWPVHGGNVNRDGASILVNMDPPAMTGGNGNGTKVKFLVDIVNNGKVDLNNITITHQCDSFSAKSKTQSQLNVGKTRSYECTRIAKTQNIDNLIKVTAESYTGTFLSDIAVSKMYLSRSCEKLYTNICSLKNKGMITGYYHLSKNEVSKGKDCNYKGYPNVIVVDKQVMSNGDVICFEKGVVGDPATDCLGQCGGECNEGRWNERYTQECLNHDLCTRSTGDISAPWDLGGPCSGEFWIAEPGWSSCNNDLCP